MVLLGFDTSLNHQTSRITVFSCQDHGDVANTENSASRTGLKHVDSWIVDVRGHSFAMADTLVELEERGNSAMKNGQLDAAKTYYLQALESETSPDSSGLRMQVQQNLAL